MDEENKQEFLWKIIIWLVGGIASIAQMCVIALWVNQNDIDSRLITIESSRCTASACGDIRNTLVRLEQTIASLPIEVPPKWFLDKVNGIDQRLVSTERYVWGRHSQDERGGEVK